MTTDDDWRQRALLLDANDPLAGFRDKFAIADPTMIYLDGNSLGRLPRGVAERVNRAIQVEWGADLIGGWNGGWWDSPARIGDQLGALLGAAPGQVLVSDQTSINLFKLAAAALRLRPGRSRLVTDSLNFPSDLYVLEGLVSLLGNRHSIIRIGSQDDDITPDLTALKTNLDDRVALLTLSHVTFKSGYLYDMQVITELAHRSGALVLWDLSHSVGAVPIALDDCDADFAIGCTYKYLNGGPGAPAFLYVNRALQDEAISPIWGWWGQTQPFAFGLDYRPAPGTPRFLTGTAPILSSIALEAALAPILEAGIDTLRAKSTGLSQFAIELFDANLKPLGFSLGSPRDAARRGSHISVRHAEGYRISRALIEEMNVIPDYREPDNIRMGFAPLYVSFLDVWEAIDRMRRVLVEKRFENYPQQRLTVT